jgi:spermidine/putrescine transport system ATP-binding protein
MAAAKPTPDDRDAITLDAVSRVYGAEGSAQVRAADLVSLNIRQNEFFTLLGPSGCGKTTLLRMIAGFDQASSGRILLSGRDVGGLPPFKRRVNTVFQSYALFPHMTVAQNVGFGLEMLGRPRAEIESRVAEMLRLVRMEDLASRSTGQISGGQQQRVALARALAPHPEVLLLDEPLSALDLKLRKAMQIELKRLQRDTGITFVFVTHDQEEALTMSDRIAVMSQGTVRQVGSPREIYDHPAERFVADFIGEANMLKGELMRVERDRGKVRLAAGIEVPARVPQGAPTSGPVTVVVRPEHAALGPVQLGPGLTAVVESAVYVGTDTQYHLRLASGEPFVVRSQNIGADASTFDVGARLQVRLGDHAVQVLRD